MIRGQIFKENWSFVSMRQAAPVSCWWFICELPHYSRCRGHICAWSFCYRLRIYWEGDYLLHWRKINKCPVPLEMNKTGQGGRTSSVNSDNTAPRFLRLRSRENRKEWTWQVVISELREPSLFVRNHSIQAVSKYRGISEKGQKQDRPRPLISSSISSSMFAACGITLVEGFI